MLVVFAGLLRIIVYVHAGSFRVVYFSVSLLLLLSIIFVIPHCHTDKVRAIKMGKIGVSIIISIPHCTIDYFILFCCLYGIFTAGILSIV